MGPRCVIYLVGKHKDIGLEQEGCNPWKEANTFVQVGSWTSGVASFMRESARLDGSLV